MGMTACEESMNETNELRERNQQPLQQPMISHFRQKYVTRTCTCCIFLVPYYV